MTESIESIIREIVREELSNLLPRATPTQSSTPTPLEITEGFSRKPLPEILSQEVLADHFDVSQRTVERWRENDTGPTWFRLPGDRFIRYHRDEVEAWLEQLRWLPATK